MSRRDKEATKRAFIEATIDLIREKGFSNLGINAIAERAGASKVLIYRYFGDLEGLLRAVAETLDPIHSEDALAILEQHPASTDPSQLFRDAVLQSHRTLKDDKIAKALMVWELSNQNELTRVFSEAREAAGLRTSRQLWDAADGEQRLPGLDINAVLAVVMAGIYYLTLRSDAVDVYNGVDIAGDEGWQRIADALADLVGRAER